VVVTRGTVAVLGLGYVGLPLAVRAAEAGYQVVALDVDEHRVKRLSAGESYVEDVPAQRLAAVVGDGRLRPTRDPGDAQALDVYVLTVPTPLRGHEPDLSAVEGAGRTVARLIRPGALVVLESTSYPGTTQDFLAPLLEAGSGLRTPGDFFLGYSPERIDPGNAVWRLENTPKLVSGVDGESLRRVCEFYSSIVERVVPVSSPRTAELAKVMENTFRQVNIALVNEIATVAGDLGVDIWEAVDAAATKPFGYMPFRPGPGVGGHCLPCDPTYLSWQVRRLCGRPLRMVELAQEVNTAMPAHVVARVAESLSERDRPLAGSRILLLGLAYKKNSSDLRESPALEVARLFDEQGARVRVSEPHVPADLIPSHLALVSPTEQEVRGADAVVLLADHDAFDYPMIQRVARYVFDTRNRCAGPATELL
jgi:UDP-N-acetyl-D-glucosamine dehydrogenase